MSDVLIPPWISPEEEPQQPMDESTSVFRSAFAPGLTQRQSYGAGSRLKISRRHATVRAEEKAVLLSVLRSARGASNIVRSRVHFALRGSFPASELLSNNTFANGVTGWSVINSSSHTVSDRIARSGPGTGGIGSGYGFGSSSAVAVTQYAPYVFRAFVSGGKGPVSGNIVASIGSSLGAGDYAGDSGLDEGLVTLAGVMPASTCVPFIGALKVSGSLFSDYFSTPYLSLSRCALVDNGANMLLQSDDFTTTWTNTRSTDSANADTAPDASVTADRIIEDATASNTHFISQSVTVSSAALDYAFCVALRAGSRTWARLTVTENTGGSNTSCYFNLSTGALGTVGTGANWSDTRASIVSMGGGWYYCSIVGRKTNAATSLTVNISLATADTVVSYSGDGTSYISAWRATMAQSSAPVRLVQTTSSASTGTSQIGPTLHIKGLPASTNGLLLPEDMFEINGELKMCTVALNSDAAGLGYLQFEPSLVFSPTDNDPVIIANPMGKFLLSNLDIQNEFGLQASVSYDLEHVYES